jgi:hypothetical protein
MGDSRRSSGAQVEILSFVGCPNSDKALELVERVVAELGIQPHIEVVDVRDADAAARLRFLGSPTIRIDGRDVEPGAGGRTDFVYACRVYRTADGLSGVPDVAWLRKAFERNRERARL